MHTSIKNIFFILVAALSAASLPACKKEKLDITTPVDLGGETWENTAIDTWLMDSLTIPYNIAVKYKWDPWELDQSKTLVPPEESKIIPAMSAIKRVWIDPYNQETGSDLFIKKYSPKQFKLVGSVQYDPNGTVVLGQAEGGNNIAFFDINQNFDKDPVSSAERMIHTSHHEFAHILHQTVLYPVEFKDVSGKLGLTGYTATWFNVSDKAAHENGYVTNYAMSQADDDFAETVSIMLMLGKKRFDEFVGSVNATAQQALRQKEQFIADYFKNVWSIDFYRLQTRVQTALNTLIPPPKPDEAFGFGKRYSTASVDPNNQAVLPQRPSWMAIFNECKDSVAAIPLSSPLTLDSIALVGASANTTVLLAYIQQDGNVIPAQFAYGVTKSGNTYTYTYVGEDANGAFVKDAMQPLLDYFSSHQFTIEWYAKPSESIFPRLKFTPVGSPGDYFLALLLP
jgi:substrate import-associated zinc metallohydrolase lipoprotein